MILPNDKIGWDSFIEKCLIDSYTFYAFIRNFGWVEFQEAIEITPDRLRLKYVKFLGPNLIPIAENNLIMPSAKDPQRGVEVQISDIVLLIDCVS